jgi:membrane peptidoglycan carboxypeptidase
MDWLMRLTGRGSTGSVTNVTSRRPRFRRFRALAGLAALVFLAGPLALILVFRFLPPPVTPLMLIRLAEGHARHQQWVSYEKISPALMDAVIASEDNLFCEETLGFDFKALRGQFEAWSDGERPRGASTITTQTAKKSAAVARSRSGSEACRGVAHAAIRTAMAEAPGP